MRKHHFNAVVVSSEQETILHASFVIEFNTSTLHFEFFVLGHKSGICDPSHGAFQATTLL